MAAETDAVDVLIVGAGFAGSLAAIALGRAGHKVMLVDIHAASPRTLFRAEKLSGDQVDLLEKLGMLDVFKAASVRIPEFINTRGGHVIDRSKVEEYGLLYPDMIDLLRAHMPAGVFKQGRIADIELSGDRQRVVLTDGETIRARLVVLATGQGEALCRKLGFQRRQLHPQDTICVGFSLRPPAAGFRFPGLIAYGERFGDGVDYLTLFPLDDGTMRGNLFMFSDIRDPRLDDLRGRGLPALLDIQPGLRRWLDGCEWIGKAAVLGVELSRNDDAVRDGVVLIGDAFRISCPSVGTGLSCALSDVVQLREHVSDWLKTPGMEAAKINSFYTDAIKAARDADAHRMAIKRRFMCRAAPLSYLYVAAHFTWRILRHWLRRALPTPQT
ncbi:MAG: NAD(P)/FAD-dependent oxidoreductase [Alphaproteobacteria bacterium]